MGLPMTASERRQTPRTALQEFAYINIEANNGGSVLNVSEGGLCFHSIAPVQKNGIVRFSISERNRRIEAVGKLAWTDDTQKIGGVQFTALPAAAREQLRKWISQLAASLSAGKASAQSSPSLAAFLTPGAIGPDTGTMPDRTAPLLKIPPEARESIPASGFTRGLATGLLVSTLLAAIFLFHDYRRELGESLIQLGERFAAKPQEQIQTMPPAPQAVTPAPQTVFAAPQTVVSGPRTAAPVAQTLPPPPPQTVLPALRPVVSGPATVSPASQMAASAPQTVASAPAPILVSAPEKIAPQPQPLATPAPLQAKLDSAEPASAAPTAPAPEPPAKTAVLAMSSMPPTTSLPAAESTRATDKPGTAPEVELASHPGGGEENAVSQMFFEVGKSKDEALAQKETEQLAQFGFPVNVVQKGHLWMSSYRVLVGPYGNDEGAEAAHKNLLSRGFKPRPFERGSRTLTLRPGLTLNSARLAGGDCEISWESYVTDATVKFTQDDYLVATANGHWVKRETKYKRDAFVYRRNGDGSRTLLEIQFSGMSRALRFGPV